MGGWREELAVSKEKVGQEGTEEVIAFDINNCALSRSSRDKKRYLVKQLEDQSPAA